MRLPKRSKPIAVSCGQGHSLAQMASGEIWAWGMNQQGELGQGSRASRDTPVKVVLDPDIDLPAGSNLPTGEGGPTRKVVAVACGFRNSGCICEVENEDGK